MPGWISSTPIIRFGSNRMAWAAPAERTSRSGSSRAAVRARAAAASVAARAVDEALERAAVKIALQVFRKFMCQISDLGNPRNMRGYEGSFAVPPGIRRLERL